jgi:hypothetical protein
VTYKVFLYRDNNGEKELKCLAIHRKTYYIGLANGQIFQDRSSSPWNFQIEATDDEINELRRLFNQNEAMEEKNFYRAHIPFMPYHFDQENDDYDHTLYDAYKMIYDLGNEDARTHIEGMGILNKRHL